ncbi:MAG: thioredoxin fold domain-containing protein [Bacteroidetes bacterium]|nr:thioredoxin fold domain-containing protein [Bacteroidota bacterium]MBS1630571.1 thioredoxin fold domain-containing protein [Bacteroidota bacterium]
MKSLLICLLLSLCGLSASAQEHPMNARDSMQLPAYERFPSLPPFKILLPDSATIFNTYNIPKGRPSVLFFFSPDCEHCQMVTDSLLKYMPQMKEARFYMFTFMPLSELRPFIARKHLDELKNVVLGKDYEFFFPMYYKATTVPWLVVYDRQKRLVKAWNGGVKMPELVQMLDKL